MIIVEGSMEPVHAALSQLRRFVEAPVSVGALSAVAEKMAETAQQRIEDGVDPDGVRWESYAALNPLYESDKKSSKILYERGNLLTSIQGSSDGNALITGSPLIYAGVHQFGALIQPRNALQLSFVMGGHLFHRSSVYIPARPYLGFSEEDRTLLIEGIETFIEATMRR